MARLQNETSYTIALIFVSAFANLFFAGIIFGWAPLQLLLIKDGVFSELCNDGVQQCNEQLSALNLVYAVGTTASIFGTIVGGYLIDQYGFFETCVISGFMNVIGLLIFAISPLNSVLSFSLASGLIGAGGIFTFMCSFKVGFCVLTENLAIVLSLANCMFDCSAVLFLGFYSLYDFGFSRSIIFTAYAGFAMIYFALYSTLWVVRQRHINKLHRYIPIDDESLCVIPEPEKITPFKMLPWYEQIFTYQFLYILVFAAVMMARSNIYLGTAEVLLTQYGDAEDNYLYTRLFTGSLPFGFLFVFAIDELLCRYGFATMFNFISLLGILYSAVSLVPVLQIQIVAFLTFTCFRAFLYSAIATYNAHIFGSANAGRVHGCAFLLAGVLNFAQWPIILLVMKYDNGNLKHLYIALMLVCIPMIIETERGLRCRITELGDIRVVSVKHTAGLASSPLHTA